MFASFIVTTIVLSPSPDFVTVPVIPWESVWQICKLLAILTTAQVMSLSNRGNGTLSKNLGFFFLLCSFSSFSMLFFLILSHAHTHSIKSCHQWSPGIVIFNDFLDYHPESLFPASRKHIGEKACQNASFRNSYMNTVVEVAPISKAGPNPFT